MKNLNQIKSIAMLLVFCQLAVFSTKAQTRYLDEVFTAVTVDTGIVYGQNYEFYNQFQQLKPLAMDVYRPAGDAATGRPVILLAHNGGFLPEVATAQPPLNFCYKGRKDSAMVELCTRFARMGYVAISYDYRLGWNNASADNERRVKTYVQANYLAMQDAKALIRYVRNDVDNNGNAWGIDASKIALGGSEAGANIALAANSLNQIAELIIPKFVALSGPFISQDTLGDFEGFGGILNYSNYPGVSSDFNCVLALGGAVLDTSIIEAGERPVIAFHGVNETFTPYNTGTIVTPTQQPVIELSGSGDFMPIYNRLGCNNSMLPNSFIIGPPNREEGIITTSQEGLYPFYEQTYEPWNWYVCTVLINPFATKAKGNLYIDTIIDYAVPRLYKVLVDPTYTGSNTVDSLIVAIDSIQTFCPGATPALTAVATGGVPPYTYLWGSSTAALTCAVCANTTAILTQTSEFTVTVTDNTGSSVTASVTYFVLDSSYQILAYPDTAVCGTDSVVLVAAIGCDSYTWSNGATSEFIMVNAPGTYSVTVTKDNCSATDAQVIVSAGAIYTAQEICVVTVDTAINKNVVVWEKDANADIDSFYIYRDTVAGGVSSIILIGQQPANAFSTFVDDFAIPEEASYTYFITAVNACGESPLSPHHKTSHLTIAFGNNGALDLSWTPYEGIGTSYCNIYVGDAPNNLQLLATVNAGMFSFIDSTPPPPPFYYQIETVNPSGCTPSFKNRSYGSSFSNLYGSEQLYTSIGELEKAAALQVLYNSKGETVVQWDEKNFAANQIKVIDLAGRLVYSANVTNSKQFILPNNIARGMYVVELSAGKQSARSKAYIR